MGWSFVSTSASQGASRKSMSQFCQPHFTNSISIFVSLSLSHTHTHTNTYTQTYCVTRYFTCSPPQSLLVYFSLTCSLSHTHTHTHTYTQTLTYNILCYSLFYLPLRLSPYISFSLALPITHIHTHTHTHTHKHSHTIYSHTPLLSLSLLFNNTKAGTQTHPSRRKECYFDFFYIVISVTAIFQSFVTIYQKSL